MRNLIAFILFLFLPAAKLPAHPGVGIVMDSKGNVYYTDLKQVLKIDIHGRTTVAVPNVHTHELYLDSHDNLFGEHLWYNGEASNTWEHYVWKYAPEGIVEKIIPDTEGFLKDYSFVRDHAGTMYYADRSQSCQKIVRKNASNQTITLMGDQCFKNIRNMISTQAGKLFIIDVFDLKEMDTRGHVRTIARSIHGHSNSTDPHQIMGITIDKHENIYVAIAGGRLIKKITKDGTSTVAATVDSPWAPSGILVSPVGDLFILEYKEANTFEARVEKVSANGNRIVYH